MELHDDLNALLFPKLGCAYEICANQQLAGDTARQVLSDAVEDPPAFKLLNLFFYTLSLSVLVVQREALLERQVLALDAFAMGWVTQWPPSSVSDLLYMKTT